MRHITRVLVVLWVLLCAAGVLSAADKKLIHCFYFTPIETASQAEWQAYYTATAGLPSKIPGLLHAWTGKLVRPMTVGRAVRQYGACMEFANEAALKTYATHPAHQAWVDVYSKVRVPGTTTVDFIEP